MNKILHKISYIKWLFLGVMIVLLLYSFIMLPDNLTSYIGVIIFVAGIYLGLDSLCDIETMTLKQQTQFQNQTFVIRLSKFILLTIVFLVLISLLFFSLQFFSSARTESLFDEFFDLGLNIWALILGLLCLLKNVNDKYKFVQSK